MANKGRGLASASLETRRRVASEGGKASHGGGRKKSIGNQAYFSEVTAGKGNETSKSDLDMEEF